MIGPVKGTAMFKRSLPVWLCASISVTAFGPPNSPFVGEWKLDPSKSTLVDRMTVESIGGNKYIFHLGGGVETIAIDGTDQPGEGGTTLSVRIEGPDAWKVVRKKDGRILLTANWRLSKDGESLTDDFTSFGQDGSASNVKGVYKRTAPGSGFAGTWVSTRETVNFVYVIEIRPYQDDGLSIIDSASQVTRNLKIDGHDYPNEGVNAAFLASSSARRIDDRTLELMDKRSDGTVFDTLQITLSSDLKTLTIAPRSVARGPSTTLVFERQ